MDAITPHLTHMAVAAREWVMAFGLAFAFMTAVELLLPRTKTSLAGRIPGLIFWAIWLPVTAITYAAFRELWAAVGIKPLIVLPVSLDWAGVVALVAAPLAGATIGDFFFYWCHRVQHRWLWRFHAVHHSVRELNATNSYHHISEPIVQTLLIVLPTSLIITDLGYVAPMMTVLIYLHGHYIHSPIAFDFGPMRAAFVDNRFHRIHHSLEERHFDKNFGAFTTLWDRLFGTAWWPAKQEWPDVGLHEIDQPRTVGEWLSLPWRHPADAPSEVPAPLRT